MPLNQPNLTMFNLIEILVKVVKENAVVSEVFKFLSDLNENIWEIRWSFWDKKIQLLEVLESVFSFQKNKNETILFFLRQLQSILLQLYIQLKFINTTVI